ncbi:MAG: DUF3322 domain-containing protein [Blastocatellia bacterium]
MNWTSAGDLRGQLLRLWERGDLLREALPGASRFPLRLALRGPGVADITDQFEAVRAWAAALAAASHLRIEWREARHRVQGTQRLPASAWVDSVQDALTWLGKRREWDRFAAMVAATRRTHPVLLPWLEKRPLQALDLAGEWPRLLAVVDWLLAHPFPRVYLRQVDLPGVHSKFIETHRGVLAELFDLALPPEAIDTARTGSGQFAARHGFLDKPARIRFRVLDAGIQTLSGTSCPDITLDAESFSCMAIDIGRVFITENETNFLAFPRTPRAIVIFGAGYGWDALARGAWLAQCGMSYWGDIDTHGFAILDQLRARFPHVASFLMDRETLLAHEAQWGEEPRQTTHDLPRLTQPEAALYDDLRDNRIQPNLRLEQERVGFGWLTEALRGIGPL